MPCELCVFQIAIKFDISQRCVQKLDNNWLELWTEVRAINVFYY